MKEFLLRELVGPLIEALLPADCPGCEQPLPGLNRAGLCERCWSNVQHIVSPLCPLCGIPLPSLHAPGTSGNRACGRCLDHAPVFDGARCALVYDGPVRTLVQLYKFEQRRDLGRFFAASILEVLPPEERIDLIVPVPLHWSRRWKRGFNQAALLARRLGRATGVPVAQRILSKRRRTKDQPGLQAAQRRRNLSGAFSLRRPATRLDGKHVLLVDDVLTTGATADECARVLKVAGASRVFVAAIARTPLAADRVPAPRTGTRSLAAR